MMSLDLILYLVSFLGDCPNDMIKIGNFCIDKFEAPNVYGEYPLVMQSFHDAELWCMNKHKRICTEYEWDMACTSYGKREYSRSNKLDRTICNNGHQWIPWRFSARDELSRKREAKRLNRSSPAGYFKFCVTPEGVHDLDGNVEEWVKSSEGRLNVGTLKGGFWAKPWTKCRSTNDVHEPTFRFYETGFRCCKSTSYWASLNDNDRD
jgi:sulfatase modifying factor 1